ncbi:MgtC/SapB family protein [Albibacterium indicum]|uniref:MgtC/SapB family protein n=1 Tax=Albibacterium indicum TaxID=2292082 RepID=UPI000E472096|nr:MgtC/SapB family protein [Pedobacter indicus]
MSIDTYEIIIRLGAAALCGALIGIERERKEWTAGMRTHMMVAVGSALYMILSAYGFDEFIGRDGVEFDPTRIAAQVVSGIGFLGAGTIIFLHRGIIRGLTTASGLWTVAAIGLAVGAGMYWAAVATTVIALIILLVVQKIERLFFSKKKEGPLLVARLKKIEESKEVLRDLLTNDTLTIDHFSIDRTDEGESEIKIISRDKKALKELAAQLNEDSRVKGIDYQ